MERDPYAGRLLLQQVEVEERGGAAARTAAGQALPTHEAYDPMAHLALMKQRGFAHGELMAMHFVTLFGYHREFTLREEEEQRKLHEQQAGGGTGVVEGTAEQAGRMAPHARPYGEEVVPYTG